MARGWESKSVEDQIGMAEPRFTNRRAPAAAVSPVDLDRLRAQQALQLTRTRIMNDLQKAQNPRYIELMTKSLADLDERLAKA